MFLHIFTCSIAVVVFVNLCSGLVRVTVAVGQKLDLTYNDSSAPSSFFQSP